MPNIQSVKTGLYNERNKILGATKVRFENSGDVVIPTKYLNFLLADYVDDNERILLFCSPENRENICKHRHFFADGTFKSCPKGFQQLYTIHAFDESSQYIKPLIFCLLCSKKMRSYEILFNLIKTTLPSWSPEKITMDFELAAIQAIKKVFPEILFRGCTTILTKAFGEKLRLFKLKQGQRKDTSRDVLDLLGYLKLLLLLDTNT